MCIDGEIIDLIFGLQVDCYKVYDIELVVDCLKVGFDCKECLVNSL